MKTEERYVDAEEMRKLIHGDGWQHYVRFLKGRKPAFQGRVNAAVRAGDLVKAQIEVALMDELEKQIELFVALVKDAQPEAKQGDR